DALDDLRSRREREVRLRRTGQNELRGLVVQAELAHDRLDVLLHDEERADAAERPGGVLATGGAIGEARGVRPEQAEIDRSPRRGATDGAAVRAAEGGADAEPGRARLRLRPRLRIAVDRGERVAAAVEQEAAA